MINFCQRLKEVSEAILNEESEYEKTQLQLRLISLYAIAIRDHSDSVDADVLLSRIDRMAIEVMNKE